MAATVSLIQMLATGCLTSAGTPIASGKARFYLPGTTTPVSVYSDSAGTTPITPPLTLTAGGTGIAYTKVPTRLILKDSSETTTYFDGLVNIHRAEQLEIQSASVNGGTETTLQTLLDGIGTSFGGTAGLWQVKVNTSATERNLKTVLGELKVSVKAFGAVGDDITDDHTALQNAFTFAANASGTVTVYFPSGFYRNSSAISFGGTQVNVEGEGPGNSIIRNTGAAANTFSVTSTFTRWKDLAITHSSSSTGFGVSFTGGAGNHIFENVQVDSHASAISTNHTVLYVAGNSSLTTSTGSVVAAIAHTGTGRVYVIGSSLQSSAGKGVSTDTGNIYLVASSVSAGTYGIDMTGASSTLRSFGSSISGSTAPVRTATTSGAMQLQATTLNASVVDQRTGAPVAYSLSVNGSVTPLPDQTESIRIIATAAITVTINAALALGFGRKFSIMLVNSSGGAVTWSFNAQYKLQGGAAPAPATGNLIISHFEYDPINSVYRETARSASMAI